MKKETLISRFKKFQSDNVGGIITLARTVYQQNFKQQDIINAFNKFVPKSEYDKGDKDDLLEWLFVHNKTKKAEK
jgi:hypothetical protein